MHPLNKTLVRILTQCVVLSRAFLLVYLVEQRNLEARKLFEVDVHQAERPLPGDALQQLLKVLPVGQRERAGAGVVLHLDAGLLRRLLPHRHDEAIRLHLRLRTDRTRALFRAQAHRAFRGTSFFI